ncbi:MAG: DeoR/GlpR family DNA-binding transcription regulator [Carbonactinosporaceae bacterium]
MLAQQRRSLILDQVRRSGAVRVSDLVARLGVSDMTVRRDLDALARDGLVEKVHGGATASPGSPGAPRPLETGCPAETLLRRAEKAAIAVAAARLVRPAMAVGLSAGSTTWMLAHQLGDVPGLTVVTNSIRVADVLHQRGTPDRTVVLIGGTRTSSDTLVGPIAVTALRSLHLDLAFIGVHGMDASAGFTTPNLMESEADRALVESARRLVVVADHTKWRVLGISTVARLDEADVLVTDAGISAEARDELADHVGELVIAEPRQDPHSPR